MPHTLGDAIDQLVSIPMRTGTASVERERLRHLYEELRSRQGGAPLTLQAAQKLVEAVREGDWVFLITGVAETPWIPAGEMDGPPGVASVARAVAYGLGARPLYLAEPLTLPTCTEPSKVAGVPVHDPELIQRFGIFRSAGAIPMPLGPVGAREKAIELLERFRPKAIVACEKLAPNAYDEYAAIDGFMPPELVDHVAAHLFDEGRRRGIVTIGIGDAGNELGLGVVEDVANLYSGPTQFRQGGYGTRVPADVAVVATCSNWGAYGISACIAYLTKNLAALHDEQIEARMLDACAAKGSIDFTAGVPINHVDGRSLQENQAIVTLLRAIVRGRLNERPPSFLPMPFTPLVQQWQDARATMQRDLSAWL